MVNSCSLLSYCRLLQQQSIDKTYLLFLLVTCLKSEADISCSIMTLVVTLFFVFDFGVDIYTLFY